MKVLEFSEAQVWTINDFLTVKVQACIFCQAGIFRQWIGFRIYTPFEKIILHISFIIKNQKFKFPLTGIQPEVTILTLPEKPSNISWWIIGFQKRQVVYWEIFCFELWLWKFNLWKFVQKSSISTIESGSNADKGIWKTSRLLFLNLALF